MTKEDLPSEPSEPLPPKPPATPEEPPSSGRTVFRWPSSIPDWVRGLGALALAILVGRYFLQAVDKVYPIKAWLFWSIAPLWGWVGLLSFSWVALGSWALERIHPRRSLPLLETFVLSASLGCVFFVLLMYIAGAFRLFHPWFAIALPLLSGLLGHSSLLDLWRRVREQTSIETSSSHQVIATLSLGFGGVVCLLVYLAAMTPDAINFDAAWCHLTVAQDYARSGKIVWFPADYARNHPHLASLVHTWGWLVPGLSIQQRWMLALHDEFAVLLWSLAGVAAAARWMLRESKTPALWVAFFLFPNILVYDSNLGGAADHYLAFFAAPLFLAAVRAAPGLSARKWMLFGILGAGALLSKYQGLYLVAGVGIILVQAWGFQAWKLWRSKGDFPQWRPWLLAPMTAITALVLVSSPHFIRNYIFYSNPFYPFAQQQFTATHPVVPNGSFLVDWVFKDTRWTPDGTLWKKFVSSIKLTMTFSVEPHYSFTKNIPSFGSLFSLLLPLLLVVKGGKRLWLGALAAWFCIFCWAITFRVDRNLQAFVPLLAAVTAAALVQVYRLGIPGKIAATGLLLLQLVWGGDAYFFSAHGLIKGSIDMIRSGYEGQRGDRLTYRQGFVSVNNFTPKNAKILLHGFSQSLGIDREILLDYPGHQGLFSYDSIRSKRELYDYYKGLGLTHLLNSFSHVYPTVQGEILFSSLITRGMGAKRRVGSYDLYILPKTPPQDLGHPYQVLILENINGYSPGIYPIEALSVVEVLPGDKKRFPTPTSALSPSNQESLLGQADVVLARKGSPAAALPGAFRGKFFAGETSANFAIWLRLIETEILPYLSDEGLPSFVPRSCLDRHEIDGRVVLLPMSATLENASKEKTPSDFEIREKQRLTARILRYDDIAEWREKTISHQYYQQELRRVVSMLIPPGSRILEVGCGLGSLIASLPGERTGIDISTKMIDSARKLHPNVTFLQVDVERDPLPEGPFDVILLSDAIGHLDDIEQALERLRSVLSKEGRLIVTYYNFVWEPFLKLAEKLGLKTPWPEQNWLSMNDIANFMHLTGYEVLRQGTEILMPAGIPLLSTFANRFAAKLPLLREAALVDYFVARPLEETTVDPLPSVSVICPCRNEKGNIRDAITRTPVMGPATELIFVDGNSTDGTREEILNAIADYDGPLTLRLIDQGDGKGKGDAVRKGFTAAQNDILMILDSDLTVPPEDLPKFYKALVTNKGEFINGVRLVYPMEGEAMRFLNLLGNKFFSMTLSWLLEQPIKDSLCGTKVLSRKNYDKIAENRAFFGDFDPFGDFDLLFGAARLNMRIVDLPVRYRARTYGDTKISRFRHGFMLLQMTAVGFRKLRMGILWLNLLVVFWMVCPKMVQPIRLNTIDAHL